MSPLDEALGQSEAYEPAALGQRQPRAASVHPLSQVPCWLRARGAVTTLVQVHTASTRTQGTTHKHPGPTLTAVTHTRGKTQPEATTGQAVS